MGLFDASLNRFVEAQAPVYAAVCDELSSGRKTSHWMWFIFPQLQALGRSSTAQFYGIESKDEALAYWRHSVLGPRLTHCAQLVLNRLRLRGTACLSAGARPLLMLSLAAGARIRLK